MPEAGINVSLDMYLVRSDIICKTLKPHSTLPNNDPPGPNTWELNENLLLFKSKIIKCC